SHSIHSVGVAGSRFAVCLSSNHNSLRAHAVGAERPANQAATRPGHTPNRQASPAIVTPSLSFNRRAISTDSGPVGASSVVSLAAWTDERQATSDSPVVSSLFI